jgi:hypothetical protein
MSGKTIIGGSARTQSSTRLTSSIPILTFPLSWCDSKRRAYFWFQVSCSSHLRKQLVEERHGWRAGGPIDSCWSDDLHFSPKNVDGNWHLSHWKISTIPWGQAPSY